MEAYSLLLNRVGIKSAYLRRTLEQPIYCRATISLTSGVFNEMVKCKFPFIASMQMKKRIKQKTGVILNNAFTLSSEYFILPDVPIAFPKTFSRATIQLEIINGINLHH